ncbi:hypothetical protein K7432_016709, partial [Basidiobolus ranarum]
GSLLSLFLFNAYIEDLAQELASHNTDRPVLSALLFANEIMLLAESLGHANQLLECITRWCSDDVMEINIAKSGFVGPSEEWKLCLYGVNIPMPTMYYYLGLPITKHEIDWPSYIESCTAKASHILKPLQLKGSCWPPLIMLHLFRTFIRSRREYAAPLTQLTLTSNLCNKVELVQQQALG